MTSMRLVIVGAGGHGRETLDVVRAANLAGAEWELLGVIDDGPLDDQARALLAAKGTALLGGVADAGSTEARFIVAIGDPATRRRVVADLVLQGWQAAPALVHPTAVVGADVDLGDGTVVAAGSHLTTNVSIGRHVMVNVGCIVSHDSTVGDHATLSPAVVVNGDVAIGAGAFLGSGAIIVRGHVVGADAVVGAGAVVITDVADGQVVGGVPARPLH